MDSSNAGSPKRRCRWGPFGLRGKVLLALVACFALAAGAALHYRVHILWWYSVRNDGLPDVQAIPNRPMPEVSVPDGWVQCRVGRLELSLPPELADNKVAAGNGSGLFAFLSDSRGVIVNTPTDAIGGEFVTAAGALCPASQQITSMPRLRLACYQASSSDFRWSMSPQEVQWHVFCITTGMLVRLGDEGHTEAMFREDMDGLIHFMDKRAALDLESTDGTCATYINFKENGEKIDPTWIRAVCQSLRITSAEKEKVEMGSGLVSEPPRK